MAELLGKSTSHISHRLDGHGLNPQREPGVWNVWYDRAEVDAFVKRYKVRHPPRVSQNIAKSRLAKIERGEVAAEVFALLEGGERSLPRIVIATKADPDLVRELWQQYMSSFEQGVAAKKRAADEAEEQKRIRQLDRERAKEAHFVAKKKMLEAEARLIALGGTVPAKSPPHGAPERKRFVLTDPSEPPR